MPVTRPEDSGSGSADPEDQELGFDEPLRTQAISLEDIELVGGDLPVPMPVTVPGAGSVRSSGPVPVQAPPPTATPGLDDSDDGGFVESPRTQAISLEEIQFIEEQRGAALAPSVRPTPRAESIPPPLRAQTVPPPVPATPPVLPRAATVAYPGRSPNSTVPPVPGATSEHSPLPVAPPPRAPSTAELDAALAEASAGDWPKRADALRAELERETDKARSAFLAYELGELTERRLRDEAGAVKLYGRALQSDPSFRPNLWAIRRVFYRRALWPNLIKLIDAEARFARDDAERADLMLEKGHVFEDKIKDRAAARDAYDRAIALDSQHAGALHARERLALVDQDDATLEGLWRALADASGSPTRRVAYLLDLAQLHAARGEAGVETALEVVSEAVALGVERGRVARLRERLAERADDAHALLAALEARVALAVEAFGPGGVTSAPADLPDAGSVVTDRATRLRQEIVACRRRGAHVAAGSGDPDRAWRLLEHAATLVPGEPLLLMDLANLAEETGKHEQLAQLCARLAALDADPARQLALSLRRADALARAGHEAETEALLDQMLAGAPGYLPVIELRKRRAMAAGEGGAEALASLYEGEAAAARLGTAFGPDVVGKPDPAWAAAAYLAAGDLYALRLNRPDEAQAAYGQALEVVPGHPEALWALVGLHEHNSRLDAACELLEAQVERHGPESSGPVEDYLEHLARLYDEQAQPEQALMALRRLAERRPDDRALTWRIVDLLRDAGRVEERLQVLERLSDGEHDPARRAALHVEIARIADEELDRPELAADRYRQALLLEPENRWAGAALSSLLRRAGRWEELVAVRRAEAAAEPDAPRAARALREAAAVLARRLGRPAEAAALYQELAERAPDDPAGLAGLVDAASGDPEQLAGALERLAAAQTPEMGLGRTLLRQAELYEAMGKTAEAARVYELARDAGGVDAHADWALFELGASGAGPDVRAAIAGLAAGRQSIDDGVRADLLEELAWLAAGDEAAADGVDAVLAASPGRTSALLARTLVASRRRDTPALAGALAALADRTSDARVAAALLLRAATLSPDAHTAAALAARAVEREPDNPGAGLEAGERLPAPTMTFARRSGLLARRAEGSSDPALRVALDLERAEEAEAQGHLAEAGRVLAGVLARAPGHPGALAQVVRLARRSGDGETLARAAYQLGVALADPESAAASLAEAARLLENDLDRKDDAARVWRAVLERLPLDDEAFSRAHFLFEKHEDPSALHELLSHRLRHVDEAEEEVPHRVARAALRARRKDLAGAARDLERVLALVPAHAAALSALADVRVQQGGRGEDAAALLERFLATTPTPDVWAAESARLRLARVLADDAGDLAGAVRVLDALLATHPDHLEGLERLATALERLGEYERAATELERLGALRGDRGARARDELRAARLYKDRLSHRGRAKHALERARALAPLDLEVVRELVQVVPDNERAAVLARALADVREQLPGEAERAPLFERLVALAGLVGDAALELYAGGALLTLGGDDGAQKLAHEQRVRAAAAKPGEPSAILSGEAWRARLVHPGWRGPLAELWACLHDAVAAMGVHEPSQLGFSKADRVTAKSTGKIYPYVLTWMRALGLGEVELYVSPGRAGVAIAIASETPILYLGADVARGDGLLARARLARALTSARERCGPLLDQPDDDLGLTFAAAVRVGGADPARVPALAAYAGHRGLDERARALGKAITRRGKKGLPAALARLGDVTELAPFLLAVRATAGRAALLVAGDVPAALDAANGDRRIQDPRHDPLALDLLVYAVSEDLLTLRRELGL